MHNRPTPINNRPNRPSKQITHITHLIKKKVITPHRPIQRQITTLRKVTIMHNSKTKLGRNRK